MLKIVPAVPTDTAAFLAVKALRSGGTVVLPTDTLYGLATSPAVEGATDALFRLKGRAADVPVAVLCASVGQAFALAGDVPPDARDLAQRHWPGPLTLVLPRRRDLGWALGEPSGTIGLRCPDSPLVRSITKVVGPIATTSANRHGHPTPATPREAAESLTEQPDLVIDGGELAAQASTVIDATGPELRVLREGPITLDTGRGPVSRG